MSQEEVAGARRHQAGVNSAWAVPNTGARSSRARERGNGALEEFRRGTRWDPTTVHGTRLVTRYYWVRQKARRLQTPAETHSKQLPSLSPRVGYCECWKHCPLFQVSSGTAAPHLQRHTEPQLLGVVAEHTPGRAQQQVMHHLLLHAGCVLLGGDPSGDEAADTSASPCRRPWGDSTLVWISSAELIQQRRAQTPPTPRSSSAAHKPGLPSHARATIVWPPSSQVTEHASGYQGRCRNRRSGPRLPSPCGSPQHEDCPETSSARSCGWWQILPASPCSHGCPAAH